MIYQNILDAMGNTPLIQLNRMVPEGAARILVKYEGLNVGGSIKTRVAYNMIMDAVRRGKINKDTIIVEPTSGNQGIGLALVGAGPVGMIAGAAAGVLLALLGRNEMEKWVGSMNVPVILRQLVTDSAVKSGVDRQREAIERAMITALADPRNGFAAGISQSLSMTLGTQLESMAKAAEMSICA